MMRLLKILGLFFVCLCAGCYYFGKDQFDDITRRPSSEWSRRDCQTIIASAMVTNMFDQNANVRVFATPYYPSVITALNRRRQQQTDWTEDQYRSSMDQQLRECSGLYLDWEKNVLVDARGNYFKDRTQIDSLVFLVTIENKSENWNTTQPYLSKTTQADNNGTSEVLTDNWYGHIFDLKNYPVFIPELTSIEDKILLLNEQNKFIRPLRVWRDPKNMLVLNETLLVLFRLRQDDYHFLDGSEKMYLVFKGLGSEVKLQFSLSMMQ